MKKNNRIKQVITILCVLAMVASLAACGDNSGNADTTSQMGTDTESQKDTENQKESETENQASSELETENESETETETETETGTYTDTENTTDTENMTNTESTTNDTNSTQDGSSENNGDQAGSNADADEILGAGSASQPYMETPIVEGDGMSMTTVSIGSGKSVYYDIYRVGGMILTIQDANAYIVYNGTTYNAKNGVLSFQVDNALASAPVNFEIGNKGNAAASFKIQFANPTGSYMNPTKISSFANPFRLHVEKGDSVGHYYKYTAEKSGTIEFYISELTSSTKNAKAFISVTNNNTSANRTTDADGTTDGAFVKVALEVSAGDEIMIQVGASPTSTWKYPAEDITWVAEYQ